MHKSIRPAINAVEGPRRPSTVAGRIARLLFGFGLVWLFMFVLAPWMAESPRIKPLAQFIENTGIDASALYYTEVEETADAEMYLIDARRYSPGKTKERAQAPQSN